MLRPDDAELGATFERAEAVGYLRLDCPDNRLAVRLTAVIKEAAEGVWAGRLRSGIGDRFNDEQTTQEYLKGLRMLLGL